MKSHLGFAQWTRLLAFVFALSLTEIARAENASTNSPLDAFDEIQDNLAVYCGTEGREAGMTAQTAFFFLLDACRDDGGDTEDFASVAAGQCLLRRSPPSTDTLPNTTKLIRRCLRASVREIVRDKVREEIEARIRELVQRAKDRYLATLASRPPIQIQVESSLGPAVENAMAGELANCLIERFNALPRLPFREVQVILPVAHRYILTPPGGAVALDDVRRFFSDPSIVAGCTARVSSSVARPGVGASSGAVSNPALAGLAGKLAPYFKTEAKVLIGVAPFREAFRRVARHVFDNTCLRSVTSPLIVGRRVFYVQTSYVDWEARLTFVPTPVQILVGFLRRIAIFRWIVHHLPHWIWVPVIRWRWEAREELLSQQYEACSYAADQLANRAIREGHPAYVEIENSIANQATAKVSEALRALYVEVNGIPVSVVPVEQSPGVYTKVTLFDPYSGRSTVIDVTNGPTFTQETAYAVAMVLAGHFAPERGRPVASAP